MKYFFSFYFRIRRVLAQMFYMYIGAGGREQNGSPIKVMTLADNIAHVCFIRERSSSSYTEMTNPSKTTSKLSYTCNIKSIIFFPFSKFIKFGDHFYRDRIVCDEQNLILYTIRIQSGLCNFLAFA